MNISTTGQSIHSKAADAWQTTKDITSPHTGKCMNRMNCMNSLVTKTPAVACQIGTVACIALTAGGFGGFLGSCLLAAGGVSMSTSIAVCTPLCSLTLGAAITARKCSDKKAASEAQRADSIITTQPKPEDKKPMMENPSEQEMNSPDNEYDAIPPSYSSLNLPTPPSYSSLKPSPGHPGHE